MGRVGLSLAVRAQSGTQHAGNGVRQATHLVAKLSFRPKNTQPGPH